MMERRLSNYLLFFWFILAVAILVLFCIIVSYHFTVQNEKVEVVDGIVTDIYYHESLSTSRSGKYRITIKNVSSNTEGKFDNKALCKVLNVGDTISVHLILGFNRKGDVVSSKLELIK